ncbi:MAG: hypothetical protein LKI58_03035 [Actinomyces sp.]|nr:hypothetical protein [Actinomyces sp.]MCI1641016.1 hypothetical protein [Actinomyces sp.]MCI1661384.1 hypothetical protein [Actinomyces sp.]MCI1690392.1 hypothetical protein [Actinomyces sp.]MCI1787033.1 hypothetical protein [Actinomyces sp.]MCI1829401.1 hypothetical protein [Actinomyces sp.]
MSDQTVDVLVFSDDVDTRKAVIGGVGLRPGKGLPTINWVEAATKPGVVEKVRRGDFALLVLDGEATKEGGMSIARELSGILDSVPPVIILTARQQDDWLATWAGAAATVPEPLDPIVLQETVASVLAGDR